MSAVITGAVSVDVGNIVVVLTKRDTCPVRVLFGQVDARDEFGIRVLRYEDTLTEILDDEAYFIPWGNIASAIVFREATSVTAYMCADTVEQFEKFARGEDINL